MSSDLPNRLGRLCIAGVSWIAIFYLAMPLLVVIAISFTTTEYLKFPPQGFTLRWYWNVVGDPTFVEAFAVSSVAFAHPPVGSGTSVVSGTHRVLAPSFWGAGGCNAPRTRGTRPFGAVQYCR